MVNVSHDRDHGRSRREVFQLIFNVELNFFDGRVHQSAPALPFFHLETETVNRADALGDSLVNRLIDARKSAHTHEIRDDLERLLL